jgi:hypothetical protein
VSEETIQPEGSIYAQTNTIYRCSNADCQQEKDKQQAERVEQRQKRADASKKRIEEIQEKRKIAQKAKTDKLSPK